MSILKRVFLCLNDAIARPFLCSRAIYPFGHCPGTAPGTDTGTLSPHCARHCRKKATANEGQAACCFATFPDAGATPSFFEKKKKNNTPTTNSPLQHVLRSPPCAFHPWLTKSQAFVRRLPAPVLPLTHAWGHSWV